ncbi:ABC transporter substrate-binding protein [Streptomyces beihaiensis]|uniref:ABC transporter substrate-binding protein n=1 Tax=Streptomyces beihaiensis TaxID=2984495 RepID=A0ABT3U0S1_9ACTN|nr:ABC transporter substrate-binding protein [Streptomyces beihaiensis]MCX3062296.1 ABC transporter substrate-binding protein [Streptomyces beihaiensis]
MTGSGGSDDNKPIVVGTTSAPSTLDPAASWDGSWELFRNVYQTLVAFPPGAAQPESDAADCSFSDHANRVYHCRLRAGMQFSDGNKLDAAAVKYSIDRIRAIGVKGGPAGLLGSLDRVSTSGDRDVTFHLNKPDATFPFVLATPAMSIVDPDDYPAKAVRDDGKISGSGPYELRSYKDGERAELVRNPHYKGFADRQNDAVTIRYFTSSAQMVSALRDKKIDVTFRGLAASDIVRLRDDQEASKGLQLVEGAGMEINYLVFNPKDPMAAKLPVRRAVAQVVDRGAIAHTVYKDTVEPLYSMVPRGLVGHTTDFFDDFGKPSASKAAKILRKAGITTPVPLTLWYTTDRYGSATGPEFAEIKRQLEASKLFKVTLKSRPWKTYEKGYRDGEYPVFGRGWFPDFPDADNFIAPFVGEKNALGTPYPSPEITGQLLPQSRRASDRGSVVRQFERAQQIMTDDARLLPLWQGKQYIAASDEIAGGERALDPSTIMLMWQLHRKTSW